MKKYEEGIDFIMMSYAIPEFAQQMVKSIDLFFKDIPKTIHIVCNYLDKEKEMSVLENMFPQEHVIVHEGVNQNGGQVRTEGSIWCSGDGTKGLIDNNTKALASYYGCWGANIGISKGNRKYVMLTDQDAIFLSQCGKDLMDLLEHYCFIGNRWDPGTLFRECDDNTTEKGMARGIMTFTKREFLDEMDSKNYVERGILRTSPICVDYRDDYGNLTWYAQRHNREFLVLPNTYWIDEKRSQHNIHYNEISKWHISPENHTLPMMELDNEQCWVNNKPAFFHLGRGGLRHGDGRLQNWIDTTNEYLEKNA